MWVVVVTVLPFLLHKCIPHAHTHTHTHTHLTYTPHIHTHTHTSHTHLTHTHTHLTYTPHTHTHTSHTHTTHTPHTHTPHTHLTYTPHTHTHSTTILFCGMLYPFNISWETIGLTAATMCALLYTPLHAYRTAYFALAYITLSALKQFLAD